MLLRTNPVKHTATRGRDVAAAVPVGIRDARERADDPAAASPGIKHGTGVHYNKLLLESIHYEYQK